jgi:hypothetical protein
MINITSIHLLTWVGFGLIGYVPNTLYVVFYKCNKEFNTYIIHTTHALSEGVAGNLRYSFKTPTFYQNYLAMRNTADVTGGKPIAV